MAVKGKKAKIQGYKWKYKYEKERKVKNSRLQVQIQDKEGKKGYKCKGIQMAIKRA